ATEDDLKAHRWICHDSETARAPFDRWIRETIAPENIAFRATEQWVMQRAIRDGAGIGFLPLWEAAAHSNLVQVLPPRDIWSAPLWIVTHVDLHRTVKVQTFTKFLKEEAQHWPV
ncbi:MAG: LysR substrate-binding domain-containing protein, partial [Pseudomonadota bacterium]